MSKTFTVPSSWKDKVLSADSIWSQVKNVLDANGVKMPQTPRRPDIRMILENTSGMDMVFRNPANHANDKAEVVPGAGDKRAAMVMVAGDTLDEQYANAARLDAMFDLKTNGLSGAFLAAVQQDNAGGLVKEAYGPAPFKDQAGKLVDVDWTGATGKESHIKAVSGLAAAFGARAAATETAFNTAVQIFIQGTTTIPEMMEMPGMVIGVASDYNTGATTTRPIVASVAKDFYGNHYDTMPQVSVHPDGYVTKIDLRNGMVFEAAPAVTAPAVAGPKAAM